MEKFDWNLPSRTNLLCLKVLSLWPDGDNYKRDFYGLYMVVVTVCFVYAHNFCQTIIIFFNTDLNVATAIIFVALTDLVSILKIHALVRNMGTIKDLMRIMDNEECQPRNKKQEGEVKSSIKSLLVIYLMFLTMGFLTVFFWAVFPVLDGSYKEYRLPFFCWYPYDYKKSPQYEITYAHEIISVAYIAIININVDAFIAALMVFVGAQCDILSDNLRNLHQEEDVEKSFVACIMHHRKILRFAQDSNNFFDDIVLGQFFSSAVSLGLTLYELTVVEPFTNEFYSFVMYEVSIFLQTFMYCWFGNEAQVKSANIPYAAYEFDWTDVSAKVKKNLVVFIARTQRPIKFSAVELFYLSLETFTRILRTAYSYFAVLNQINSVE